MDEFRVIMTRFANSGWELIATPARAWLDGNCEKADLIKAIRQADDECGSCGCEYDPLYKKALALCEMV